MIVKGTTPRWQLSPVVVTLTATELKIGVSTVPRTPTATPATTTTYQAGSDARRALTTVSRTAPPVYHVRMELQVG